MEERVFQKKDVRNVRTLDKTDAIITQISFNLSDDCLVSGCRDKYTIAGQTD